MKRRDPEHTGGGIPPSVEKAVREAVGSLPDEAPDSAFRARMRRQFVERTLTPPEGLRPSWLDRLSPRRRRGSFWAVALPVAAAGAAALLILALNRGPQWRVIDPPAAARLIVDGETIGASDASRLGQRLRPGAMIVSPDTALVTLSSPGNLFVQLLPGTEMRLPAPPGRWFGRTSHAWIATGELRITTDQGFSGARLFIDTPEVTVEVLGTTLAVIRPDFGTCICVFDGTVYVAPRGGTAEHVAAGRRLTLFKEDGTIDRGEILPEERMKLGMLQSLCAPAHHPGPGGHGQP